MLRILLFLLLFIPFAGLGQPAADSQKLSKRVIDLDVFVSLKEKQLFSEVVSGKEPDYLDLFMASDSSFEDIATIKQVRSKLNAFVQAFSISRNPGSKELKKIYTRIHDAFLSKYTENPMFGSIFKTGDYNCVTASALYSLLLDQFSIGYTLHETPYHVYLIVAPGTHNVIYETTTPGEGMTEISKKTKAEYLDYLYSNKLISEEEYKSPDKNKVFEKYYFDDQSINKRQLAGLLYYNKGVAAAAGNNYSEAYKNFEKAFCLYPSETNKYFVVYCLANILLDKKMKESPEACPFYLRFIELNDNDMGRAVLKEYLEGLTQKLLFQHPQPKKYRMVYGQIASVIRDSSFKKELSYNHYYNTAHYYDILRKYDSALVYLDSVYSLNSSDLLVQELITGTLLEAIQNIRNETVAVDSLDGIFRRYKFISRNSKLGEFYAYNLSRLAAQAWLHDQVKEGTRLLGEIKQLLQKEPELIPKAEPYVTPAFFEIYSYYMRHSDYKKAKVFLLSVNKYYPENEELKRRMVTVNGILN